MAVSDFHEVLKLMLLAEESSEAADFVPPPDDAPGAQPGATAGS